MSEQTAILMITAKLNKANVQELPSYLEQIKGVFGANGAKPLARYKIIQDLIGEDSPEIVSVTEFPNAETIEAMLKSDAFTGLADLRARVFSKLNLMISESM